MTVYQNKLSFDTGLVVAMSGRMKGAPANGFSALQERALDLIDSRSDGLRQSELRRLLRIDSSKCSKVVSRMETAGLIRRERVPASSTYLIRLARPSGGNSCRHIDSYLTEIYLLYLTRGVSC
jgi:DNA-binding MarR family transcriptional regulator